MCVDWKCAGRVARNLLATLRNRDIDAAARTITSETA